MSKTADILNNLTGDVQIAALVEGTLVPIIIGTVKEVKVLLDGETIDYTLALSTGADNLDKATADFNETLTLINAERAKANLPPLTIPGA